MGLSEDQESSGPERLLLAERRQIVFAGREHERERLFRRGYDIVRSREKEEVDRSVMLDPYFIKYYSDIKGIDQIYIGYEYSGLFRQYPGNNANQDYEYPKQNTYDPRKRPWYIDAKAATKETIQGRSYGETIISSPYKGYSLGIWMVTFAKAIYQGTSLLGVIGIDISIDNLQKKMLGVHFL